MQTRPYPSFVKSTGRAVLIASVSFIMIACSDSNDNDEPEHQHTEVDTAGRLALSYSESSNIDIFDIQENAVIDSFTLPGASAPRLYASPEKRYVVAVQRGDNSVSFIDSGLYVEDHGDHMHEYANDPAMSNFQLNGTSPTHYTQHSPYALIFNDAAEGVVSSVDVFSDSSIGQGQLLASLNLENSMHGVAKWSGDKLFVTRRDASITDTVLPAEIERYAFDGTSFTLEHLYEEQCPLLHGAGANEDYLVFGCGDGVLSIDLNATDYAATHLPEPEGFGESDRVGTVIAHHEVSTLIGAVGFPERRLFTINPDAETPIAELALPNDSMSVVQGFTTEGHRFYSMTNDGQLHFYNTDDWSLAASLQVVDLSSETAESPKVTSSAMEDILYVLDPNTQQVLGINTETAEITQTITLGQAASNLVWVGFAADEHEDH